MPTCSWGGKGPGSIIIVSRGVHLRYVLIRQQHPCTQASQSLICCSLASLSSADSVASWSLICCSLASLSFQLTRWPVVHAGECSSAAAWPLSLQLIRWPVGPSSVIAWPLSLQLTRWPVGPSSVVAWPLSLQLTRWPVGHVFAAEVIAFIRQSEQRA